MRLRFIEVCLVIFFLTKVFLTGYQSSLAADTAALGGDGVAIQNAARRINDLQLLGTHNSYHLAPDPVAMKVVSLFAPGEAKSIDCSQRPLTDQLGSLGCRHFDLDLDRDDEGKLFSQPLAMQMARQQQVDVPPHDPQGRLRRPGIKILHSPDFDFRTTCYTFDDALREVRAWSDSRRDHVPIFLLLELKSDSFSPTTRPIAWDDPGLVAMERESQAAFPRGRLHMNRAHLDPRAGALRPDEDDRGAGGVGESLEGLGDPSRSTQEVEGPRPLPRRRPARKAARACRASRRPRCSPRRSIP